MSKIVISLTKQEAIEFLTSRFIEDMKDADKSLGYFEVEVKINDE